MKPNNYNPNGYVLVEDVLKALEASRLNEKAPVKEEAPKTLKRRPTKFK